MNNVTLSGRLGNDLELYSTNSNKEYTRFNLAVTDDFNKEKTHWIPVVLWGKLAINMVNLIGKGNRIIVQGKLETNNYKDKNGNEVRGFNITASNIEIIDFKNKENQSKQPFSDKPIVDLSDDNLPF